MTHNAHTFLHLDESHGEEQFKKDFDDYWEWYYGWHVDYYMFTKEYPQHIKLPDGREIDKPPILKAEIRSELGMNIPFWIEFAERYGYNIHHFWLSCPPPEE